MSFLTPFNMDWPMIVVVNGCAYVQNPAGEWMAQADGALAERQAKRTGEWSETEPRY